MRMQRRNATKKKKPSNTSPTTQPTRQTINQKTKIEMTTRELIEILSEYGPDTEVRIATQPTWPFEHEIAGTDDNQHPTKPEEICQEDYETKEEFDEAIHEATRRQTEAEQATPIVYLLEGWQIGYLPEGIGNS